MKPPVIVRKNRFFCIDKSVLPVGARKVTIVGALYAAIYEEFKGAAYTERYKTLTIEQRMQSMNDYAWKWLDERGYK